MSEQEMDFYQLLSNQLSTCQQSVQRQLTSQNVTTPGHMLVIIWRTSTEQI